MFEDVLARLPLFQNLSPASRQALDEHMRPLHLAKGQVLFRAGEPADGFYILLQGKVKLTKPSRQRDHVGGVAAPRESLLSLIGPGEVFGELSLLDGGTRSTSATAMLECRLCFVPRDEMNELVEQHHDITQAMLRQMTHRVRQNNETISGLVLSDVPGRLSHLLLSLGERFGTRTERGIEVHHDLTQAELAQVVGASRETVNKVLTDFANRGWITISGKGLVIREPARLQARID